MNNYIQLVHPTAGAKKYTTKIQWEPSVGKPSTVRATQLSVMDVTYGPAKFKYWEGEIKARVTPATGFGTPEQLEATLNQMGTIAFTDHYGGAAIPVHVQEWKRISNTPMWDGSSNVMFYAVRLQSIAGAVFTSKSAYIQGS